jgi:hypothetical protein
MGMRVGGSMSTAALQSSGVGNWQQRQQSFNALSAALQAGNLGAAKSSFAALSRSSGAAASANPSSPLAQIGQALQSDNLAAAQKVFNSLLGSRAAPQPAPASASASASATPSGRGSVINTTA